MKLRFKEDNIEAIERTMDECEGMYENPCIKMNAATMAKFTVEINRNLKWADKTNVLTNGIDGIVGLYTGIPLIVEPNLPDDIIAIEEKGPLL